MPDGSIMLMGGYDDISVLNDVWRLMPAGSQERNPSHTYTAAGIYPVALQVYNTGGYNSTQKTGFITVTGSSAPVANGTIINQSATIYIGEEGLNVTHALNPAQGNPGIDGVPPLTSIGWWASFADPYNTTPSRSWNLGSGELYKSFTVIPEEFADWTGAWYVLDGEGKAISGATPAFYVADPRLDVKIWDFEHAKNVTGKSILHGTRLGFRIDTNMYAAVNESYRSPYRQM
jgi:PKD repeat protein